MKSFTTPEARNISDSVASPSKKSMSSRSYLFSTMRLTTGSSSSNFSPAKNTDVATSSDFDFITFLLQYQPSRAYDNIMIKDFALKNNVLCYIKQAFLDFFQPFDPLDLIGTHGKLDYVGFRESFMYHIKIYPLLSRLGLQKFGFV